MPLDPPVITATLPSSFPTIIPVRAQFPGLHADCIRKVALQRDTGRQRAVKNAHLGDLAVLVEQDEEYAVDRGVSDLQPEVCGVVELAAEGLHIGGVGRQSVDGLYGFHGDLAAGDWPIAERAVQHHVLGEQRVRVSLSAPPLMQSTKDSKVSRCGANVVMVTPR